jgi:hypothetical protein
MSPCMGWAREIYRIWQLLYIITSVRLFVDSFHQHRLRLFRQPKQRFCLNCLNVMLENVGYNAPHDMVSHPTREALRFLSPDGLEGLPQSCTQKRRNLRQGHKPRISCVTVSIIHLSRLRNDRQKQTLSHVYHRLRYQLLNLATWLLCATVLPMTQQQNGGFTVN